MSSLTETSAGTRNGALEVGGGGCRMWISRSGNVPCYYFYNFHDEFKIVLCRLSNLRKGPYHVNDIFSHVDKLHVACRF